MLNLLHSLPMWIRIAAIVVVLIIGWAILGAKFLFGMLAGALAAAIFLYKKSVISEQDIASIADWAIDFFRKVGDYPDENDVKNHMRKR